VKNLKEIWFEFWFEKLVWKEFEKKGKTNLAYLFGSTAQQPAILSPAAAHDRCLLFPFPCLADIPVPPVSLPRPLPFFFSPSSVSPGRRRRDSRRARPPSLPFPPRSSRPIKAAFTRVFKPAVSLSFALPGMPRPSMASAGRRKILPPPLASLSLGCYLSLSPSSCFPLCSHIASTRAQAPLSPLPPPLFLAAAGEGQTPPPFFLSFSFGSPGAHRACPAIGWRLRAYPVPIRGSPERHPIRRRRRSSSSARFLRLQARTALLHVVISLPRSFLFLLELHRRTLNLAGATAPPPSGASRRRGTGVPLDSSVTCANTSATRRDHPRTIWCTARAGQKIRSSQTRSNSFVSGSARLDSLESLNEPSLGFSSVL
jgi:hypothetical protein